MALFVPQIGTLPLKPLLNHIVCTFSSRLLAKSTVAGLRSGFLLLTLLGVISLPVTAQQPSSAADTTNAPATPSSSDSETLQALLKRIEQLERERTSRTDQDTLVIRLQNRILELESKVEALQEGRLLPEISIPASEGLTPEELEQQIRIVDRKLELANEANQQRLESAPIISIGAQGFSFASADTNYLLRIRGLLQGDTRSYFDDNPLSNGNDGFFLRRARPIIEGTLFGDLDFRFTPEFGAFNTAILDAYLDYQIWPELEVRLGRFKGPVGFENLLSDSAGLFNERSLPTDLVPLRNQGIQLSGTLADGLLNYSAGVFSATGDGRNASNDNISDDLELAGRLFVRPFIRNQDSFLHGLGLGVSGSFSQVSSNATLLPSTLGGTRPGYLTPAGQQFFAYNPSVGPVVADGTHWRVSPHLIFTKGPFGIMGEYVISQQGVLNATTLRKADLTHHAWQVAAQWVLTGEPASFDGIVPTRPVTASDFGWGAWQLVARFGQLDLDDATFQGFSDPATSARSSTSWSVGINWWLNQNLRVLTSFTRSTFNGGGVINPVDPATHQSPATVTHQDENALLTRVQLSF